MLSQFRRFGQKALINGIFRGLRINPQYSPVETDLYNSLRPRLRLGVTAEQLAALALRRVSRGRPRESRPEPAKQAEAVETHFKRIRPDQWLNMGSRHPNLRLILEPGSAFTWRTGFLVSTVEDIVENGGVTTAMLDVSFACHMPDCLEMPYKPAVIGAHEPADGEKRWRMGGTSCLAGDYCGDWASTAS